MKSNFWTYFTYGALGALIFNLGQSSVPEKHYLVQYREGLEATYTGPFSKEDCTKGSEKVIAEENKLNTLTNNNSIKLLRTICVP
jgi:hypothetical protein